MGEYRFTKSTQEFEKAKDIIPGGAHTSHRPFFKDGFPCYMVKGKGSHIWDLDGNEYIDYLLGFGSVILGHSYDEVNQTAIEQLNKGTMLSRSPLIQNELARELIRLIPCAEMVFFFKTGSGATSAAVRIARAFTGRDKVVRWGYNGWHDWCSDVPAGVPEAVRDLTFGFNYNDLGSLEEVLEANKDQVACVIMEPVLSEKPEEGFLKGVRDLTNKYGTLLVFDEIKTFPRMAMGGAQEYYGVTPDMAAIGKGMGNGFPVAAVVGEKGVMDAAISLRLSATFNVEIVGMAAALTTLREVETKNGLKRIWETGQRLMDGLEGLVKDTGVDAEVVGYPPMPHLKFNGETVDDRHVMHMAFSKEALMKGVFLHPYHVWFTCLSHTDEDIDRTLEVCRGALERVRDLKAEKGNPS